MKAPQITSMELGKMLMYIKPFTVKIMILALILSSCNSSAQPSDGQLEASFYKHQANYKRVVDLFFQHKIYRFEIEYDGDVDVNPEGRADELGQQLVAELKNILGTTINVGVVNAAAFKHTYDELSEVQFLNYRQGFLTGPAEVKGIVYILDDSEVETIRQLDTIDETKLSDNGKTFYKKILPHWYLFRMSRR